MAHLGSTLCETEHWAGVKRSIPDPEVPEDLSQPAWGVGSVGKFRGPEFDPWNPHFQKRCVCVCVVVVVVVHL